VESFFVRLTAKQDRMLQECHPFGYPSSLRPHLTEDVEYSFLSTKVHTRFSFKGLKHIFKLCSPLRHRQVGEFSRDCRRAQTASNQGR
jgi:hypothetical protein